MKRNCRASLLTILLIIAFSSIPTQSQQKRKPDEDVIKISTELVQVDVLVTDKNNRPVGELKREDFELYDNNQLQVITHFSYETSKTRQAGKDTSADGSLPRVITPGQLNRVMAFVIDTLHMKHESVYRARKMLEDFVSTKMAPGDLVLILPTAGGSGLYQQFTSDQRVLRGAIDRLRPAFIQDNDTPARRGGLPQQMLDLLPALAEGRDRVPQAAGQGGAGTGGNIAGLLEEADVRATLNALNTLIDSMGKLPGRKISVFVSEGFNAFQTKMSQEVSEITAHAARANVVFYSIDPGGLEPLSATSADIVAGLDVSKGPIPVDSTLTSPTGLVQPGIESINNANAEKRRDYFQSHDALNAIAVDTGGKFFRNSNEIKTGLSNMLEENSAHYLLGFQPEKWDGKFHKVNVAVRGRPDLIVSTRKGYMAKSDAPKGRGPLTAKAAEAIEAINSPLVRRDIDLQLSAFYLDDAKQQPVMTALLHVDTAKLKFSQAEGKHRTKLEVTGFVLDATGRAVDSFSKTAGLNLDAQVYQALVKDGLLMVRSGGVKPGTYQVKILAREPETGFIGTASGYVEIPDFKADRLALSSIFTDPRLLQQDKAGEIIGVSSTLTQRRFLRSGELAYATIVYNAKTGGKDNKPELQMVTRILRGDRVIFNGQPKPVEVLEGSNLPSRIITGGIMQLSGLAPGDYTLEVIVVDKLRKKEGAAARQEIDFSVE